MWAIKMESITMAEEVIINNSLVYCMPSRLFYNLYMYRELIN